MDLTGNPAVDLASASLMTQVAILAGMINAKLVDAKQMRDWLQSLLDDLKPGERGQPYGVCLQQVIKALEANLAGLRPAPPRLH